MLIAWVCLLVALAGLVIYCVSQNPKVAEAGRLMFACGLLVTLFACARVAVRIG